MQNQPRMHRRKFFPEENIDYQCGKHFQTREHIFDQLPQIRTTPKSIFLPTILRTENLYRSSERRIFTTSGDCSPREKHPETPWQSKPKKPKKTNKRSKRNSQRRRYRLNPTTNPCTTPHCLTAIQNTMSLTSAPQWQVETYNYLARDASTHPVTELECNLKYQLGQLCKYDDGRYLNPRHKVGRLRRV